MGGGGGGGQNAAIRHQKFTQTQSVKKVTAFHVRFFREPVRKTESFLVFYPKLQALVYDILPSFGGRCRKAMLGVWFYP